MNKINIINKHLPKILLGIFAALWIWLAINPLYRFDWFLENIVIFIFFPVVIWSYFKMRLSNLSYFLIFIFAVLHISSAHYTYGDTPWGYVISIISGSLRNNFDRIVHFLYGLLLVPVANEVLAAYLPNKKIGKAFLIFSVLVMFGAVYEMAEYMVGVLVEPEAGLAFLGFQGDVWDTQKDMILQAFGAILGLLVFRKKIK